MDETLVANEFGGGLYSASSVAPPLHNFSDDRCCFHPVIVSAVANMFGVPDEQLALPGRQNAKISFSRQVAMYLTHVHLALTLTQTGALFGRDRTTVAHACEQVENLRDDPAFDQALDLLEWSFSATEEFHKNCGWVVCGGSLDG